MYLAANQCWKEIYIRPVAYYYLLVIFSLLIFNLSYGSRTSYRTKAAQLPLSCLVDLSRARGKEVLSMVLYRWSSTHPVLVLLLRLMRFGQVSLD
jgi:hypothetical protein